MSFCNNDSFGQIEAEDSNVILNDAKDVNNISFECANNEQQSSFKENPAETCDIFNQIPMSIDTQQIDRRNYYHHEYTINHISSILKRLYKIINSKILLRKLCALIFLRNYSHKKKVLIIKSELLYTSIISSLKSCLRINRIHYKEIKLKYFLRWKEDYMTNKQLTIIKEQIETAIEKKNEKELNELNAQLIDREKEVNDLNKNLLNLQSFEAELKRKLKTFEDKEITLLEKIKVLEQKNGKYKEMMNNKMTRGVTGTEYKPLENKIQYLEGQIGKLQEENREKENIIKEFGKEMNVMLMEHEQKIDTFQTEENIKRIASPKGVNTNGICFTTGSVNKKSSSSLRNNYSKPKNNHGYSTNNNNK